MSLCEIETKHHAATSMTSGIPYFYLICNLGYAQQLHVVRCLLCAMWESLRMGQEAFANINKPISNVTPAFALNR